VRTVVLAGGRSQRMGFDKLTALFAGEPLARRVARGLLELEPLFVATPQVAEAIAALGVRVLVTEPTAGPSATLALAHAAIAQDALKLAPTWDGGRGRLLLAESYGGV